MLLQFRDLGVTSWPFVVLRRSSWPFVDHYFTFLITHKFQSKLAVG